MKETFTRKEVSEIVRELTYKVFTIFALLVISIICMLPGISETDVMQIFKQPTEYLVSVTHIASIVLVVIAAGVAGLLSLITIIGSQKLDPDVETDDHDTFPPMMGDW